MSALSPIKFPEANKNLLKPESMTDEECSSLWVYSDGGQCISCWKMSFTQRMSALVHGRIWLSVLSGRTQPPVWLDSSKTVFLTKQDAEKALKESENNAKRCSVCDVVFSARMHPENYCPNCGSRMDGEKHR